MKVTVVKLIDLTDYLDRHGLRIQTVTLSPEDEKPWLERYVPLVIEATAIRAIRGHPCTNEGR